MANRLRSLTFAAGAAFAAALSSIAAPANAESITRDANCYFFRDETLEIIDTCELYTDGLWEGPITHRLAWPDGVVTVMEPSDVCGGNFMVDGRCSTPSYRSYDTLDRISDAEVDRLIQMGAPYLPCHDIGDNSVCMEPLQDI